MPAQPIQDRVASKTQAATMQRTAFDVTQELQRQLKKAKSLASVLSIAGAVEKMSKVWQDSHVTVVEKRLAAGLRVAGVNTGNGNGHASAPRAGRAAPLDTPTRAEKPKGISLAGQPSTHPAPEGDRPEGGSLSPASTSERHSPLEASGTGSEGCPGCEVSGEGKGPL